MAPYLTVCCLACGVVLCLLNHVASAPSSEGYDEIGDCRKSDLIMETCQKCAVKSRSNIVYPLCCQGKEEAREWCERFLAYGHHDLGYNSR